MSTVTQQGTGEGRAGGGERGGFGAGARSRAAPAMQDREARRQDGGHDGEGLANALGWLSLGLGVAQLTAPRALSRMIGVRPTGRSVAAMRAVGAREIAHGFGILSRPKPAGWVWTRVAGDAMDLALLGGALVAGSDRRDRTAAATAAVLGVTALDLRTAAELSARRKLSEGTVDGQEIVRHSITVFRPLDEVYRFWHDFENLPRFMANLDSVQVTGDGRSHWAARGPAGVVVEWDAEVIEERENELIAWRSVELADVYNAGVVRFRPASGGRGTEVVVEMQYAPPGGKISSTVLKLFRKAPQQQVKDDLRRFKQVLETGDVVLSDATVVPGPHPARPPSREELQALNR